MLVRFEKGGVLVDAILAVLHATNYILFLKFRTPRGSEKSHEFLNRHFCLYDDRLRRLRRHISAVPWDHNMKVRLRAVAEIDMAARLMMHVKPRSQQGLEKFS